MNSDQKSSVATAIVSYMSHFFSCGSCRKNFFKKVQEVGDLPSDSDQSLLWLWTIHNMANKALHGKATEVSWKAMDWTGVILCRTPGSRRSSGLMRRTVPLAGGMARGEYFILDFRIYFPLDQQAEAHGGLVQRAGGAEVHKEDLQHGEHRPVLVTSKLLFRSSFRFYWSVYCLTHFSFTRNSLLISVL